MLYNLILSVLISLPLIIGICLAQDDISVKITPAAIASRISEFRMGDLIIKTKPGAEVKIEQLRHEFLFGTAIANQLVEKDENAISAEDRKMFLKILAENFNYAVHENALKWYDCEKSEKVVDYYLADRIWEICHELNIPMRGHCIFWGKDRYIMPWLNNLNNDQLRAAVVRRALDVTKHFKGHIDEFDLNNEMIHGNFFRRRLGYGIINEMAWVAKAGNPDIILYVNDYGILVNGGVNSGAYIKQIENLLANGVPIGGIGCQGHRASYSNTPMSAEHVQRTLDRLAKFNLPIKITECLFDADTEEGQAEELRKIFPIYFAHPSVEAIIMWGFWETVHWQPKTTMWRKDWTPTPQGLAYRDLVFNQWWSKTSGKANNNGIFKAHVFYGNYSVMSNGETQKITLSKKSKSFEVIFK